MESIRKFEPGRFNSGYPPPSWQSRADFNVGVALEGVACEAGCQPFSFSRLSELPSGVLWILDVSPDDFCNKIPKGRGFAHRDFLCESLSVIADRCCLPRASQEDLWYVAFELARIAAKTLVAADNMHSLTRLPLREVPSTLPEWIQWSIIDIEGFESRQACSELFLRETMKRMINVPLLTPPIRSGLLGRQDQYYSGISYRDITEQVIISRIPCGNWREMMPSHFGMTVSQQMETLSNLDEPILVCSAIVDVGEFAAKITRNTLRNGARRWMTHPDLIFMASSSTLVPEKILVCDRYVTLPSSLSRAIYPLAGVERSSVSYGIASMAACVALATSVIRGGVYLSTSRAAWMSALLRFNVLNGIMQLNSVDNINIDYYSPVGVVWHATKETGGSMKALAAASFSSFGILSASPNGGVRAK